jgi:very-short-patch-repair endonuclease
MQKICKHCNKEFTTLSARALFCSAECKSRYKNLQQYPDGSDYVECKICKYRGDNLHHHIKTIHKMTIAEYCLQFGIDQIELISNKCRQHNSEMQKKAYVEGRLTVFKSDKTNPAFSEETKKGRNSPYSVNFKGYDGLTQEEKELKVKELKAKMVEKKKQNNTNPLSISYYTSKGYTEAEAKELIRERQTTFSLEKCIEKYGEEAGKEIFENRQSKWQSTLNSKPEDEIKRINAAKMMNGKGYSKISQDLFNQIYDKIKDDFKEIYFAEVNGKELSTRYNEFMAFNPKTRKKYFLDFYIKDNNKIIEFDGDYWHGEKRGNQQRDINREDDLKSLGFTNILRIKERDYKKNPSNEINKCLEYIYAK